VKPGLLLAAVIAGLAAGSALPVGTEITGLRSEYAVHYSNGDGTVRAFIYSAPICRRDAFGRWQLLDRDLPHTLGVEGARHDGTEPPFSKQRPAGPRLEPVTDGQVVYPDDQPFHTGTVYGNHGAPLFFSDDLMRFAGGVGGPDNQYRAWARFNTTSIPDAAQVTGLVFRMYCFDADEPWYNLMPVPGDPSRLPARDVYDGIGQGMPYSAHQSIACPGWNSYVMPAQARADLQSRLPEDWWAVGIHEWEVEQQHWYFGSSYGHGNSGFRPYVEVEYLLDAPNLVIEAVNGVGPGSNSAGPLGFEVVVRNVGPQDYTSGSIDLALQETRPQMFAPVAKQFSASIPAGASQTFALEPYAPVNPRPGPIEFTFSIASAAPPEPAGDNQSSVLCHFYPAELDEFLVNDNFNLGRAQWNSGGANGTWDTTRQIPPCYSFPTVPPTRPVNWSETHFLTDSKSGAYQNNADCWAEFASAINLTGVDAPFLVFSERYRIEAGYDTCITEFSTDAGNTWLALRMCNDGVSPSWPGYDTVRLDLTPYVGNPDCRLRFRFRSDNSVSDDGWYVDDVIVGASRPRPPTVTVVAPNGGEVWPAGQTRTILCEHGGGRAVTDSVELSTDGGNTWTFQFKEPAASAHQWLVPSTPTTQARIKVVAINNQGMAEDASDADFTIVDLPRVVVVMPNGGEVWPANSVQTITCEHAGGQATTDSIELSTDGGASWLFQFKEPASNLHTWSVPNLPTDQARIKIVAIGAAGSGEDASDEDFTIAAPPTVIVTSPNGGEVWPIGQTKAITCIHGGGRAVTDSVELSTDGGATWVFQFKEPAGNSHNWQVPNTPTTQARIKVVAVNDQGLAEDGSDADFTIADLPFVTVVVPNGGEVWPVGSSQNILCTHGGGTPVTDSILLSTDGGASWLFQFKEPAADLHQWTVSNHPSDHARIKIVTLNAIGSSEDASDTDFTIQSVVVHDVGCTAIVEPAGSVVIGRAVFPRVRVQNFGGATESFMVEVRLSDSLGATVFDEEEQVAGLGPGRTADFRFAAHSWTAGPLGQYTATAWTELAGDAEPANDTAGPNPFAVVEAPIWPPGWREVAKVPGSVAVKDGGWLAPAEPETDGRVLLYAAKGNKSSQFLRYDAVAGDSGSWTTLESIPADEGGRVKPPKKGCAGVSDGLRYIYMTKGNNTTGFWKYDIQKDSWTRLPDVPLGPEGKKVKGGNDLAYVPGEGDSDWVYLMKGYRTEFYRFSTGTGRWDTLVNIPFTVAPKYDKGSFLVYDGDRYLYAHQAKYTDELKTHHFMFRFDLVERKWKDTLVGMPVPGMDGGKIKVKKSKDGGSGVWNQGAMYALKGGNTCQFFRYEPAPADSWRELDTVPSFGSTEKKKKVKSGGDLAAFGPGAFFAFKGNKTFEFWRYVTPSGAQAQAQAQARSGVMAGPSTIYDVRFSISPNPIASGFATISYSLSKQGPLSVTVFDVAGRSVFSTWSLGHSTTGSLPLDLRGLRAGVYLVRLDADGRTQSRKLVVQR